MNLPTRAKRSDEPGLNEYIELNGKNNRVGMQRTFDVTVSDDDIDRLPGISESTTFAPPEYLTRKSQQYV